MILLVAICSLCLLSQQGQIISNLPVVVTSYKSYSRASPTWVTSPYFRAGNQAVVKTLTGSNVASTTYTFTFSSALPGIPDLAYGIKNYRGNDYLGQEFYEIKKIGLTAATFSVSIQIFGVTNLWLLTVAYIAVDPTFPHHLNSFDNVPINATGGDIVNISARSSSLAYYAQYINYTWQTAGRRFTKFTTPLSSNKIVLFMTSLWIQGTFGTFVKFHVYTNILNESFYTWNATLERNSMITNVHFSEVIFNSDDVQSSQKYFIVYQLWYNDYLGGFLPIPPEFVDNFIMGVTTFQCSNAQCGFQYQWEYTNKTINGQSVFGVELLTSITLNNKCGFSWSETSIFYMMTWSCKDPYFYFNLSTGLCQTGCGGFTFQSESNFTCVSCTNTDCYQCDPGAPSRCTDCASYLHYELVDGKCTCMQGFLAANSSCLPCDYANAGCYNCTYDDGAEGVLAYDGSKFECLDCNNTQNYFLSGILCEKCILSNCVFCENLTACSACKDGYNFSSIQTCIVCNVIGCLYCSMVDPDVCLTCYHLIGYYEVAATQKCISRCGDGIHVSADEQCDDHNLLNYDGCSLTCTIEDHFTCEGYPLSACYFAETVAIDIHSQVKESDICDTVTFGFSFTPSSDTFAQPNVNWQNFFISPNISILQLNTSMVSYSAGILYISYFLLGHLQNDSLIFDFNFSTLIQNSSIFQRTNASTLIFQVSTVPQALMECCIGFVMSLTEVKCDEICGDSMLFILACDDGNLLNEDGCNSVCQIEEGYVCMNGSSITPSICSYNGSISLILETGNKNPVSNSMTLTYTLKPSIPIFALNDRSTNFYQLVSFVNNQGVTITSAQLNLKTNQLVINIDYNKNLQDTELLLQITPPNSPQAVLVPKLSSNWAVSATNQLAVIAYSQEDYQVTSKIAPFANAIEGSFLALVALSMVFKKFIGLQLACFVQLGYLSLLQNKQIATYSEPISSWKNVFGYNKLHFSSEPPERLVSPYNIYGFQKYFGFSNNFMIILALSVYVVSIIFLLISSITSKNLSRRLKKAAFNIASEIGYTLAVFTTPNIITGICIQAYQGVLFQKTFIWSKLCLIGGISILSTAQLLYLSHIEQSSDIGAFFRKYSKLGTYMPVIFNIKLVVITILFFIYHHVSKTVPQYCIFIVQFAYLLLIVFGRPHKKPVDLARSICLEVGLLYILVMRFVEVNYFELYVKPQNSLYSILAFCQYSFYGLGIIVSTISLFYHLVKQFCANKVQPNFQVNEQISPQAQNHVPQDSMSKLSPDSDKKGKLDQKPLIFDLEQMNLQASTTNMTSVPSFSPRKKERKVRRRAR